MAKIEAGKQKDEELSGGFNANPDDDTFMLDRDIDYPGELPEMDELPVPETKPLVEEDLEINDSGISKAPKISLQNQNNIDNVWDMFEEGYQTEQPAPEPEAPVDYAPGMNIDEAFGAFDGQTDEAEKEEPYTGEKELVLEEEPLMMGDSGDLSEEDFLKQFQEAVDEETKPASEPAEAEVSEDEFLKQFQEAVDEETKPSSEPAEAEMSEDEFLKQFQEAVDEETKPASEPAEAEMSEDDFLKQFQEAVDEETKGVTETEPPAFDAEEPAAAVAGLEQKESDMDIPDLSADVGGIPEAVSTEEKFEIAVKELDEPSDESIDKSLETIDESEELDLGSEFKKMLEDDLLSSKKKKKKDDEDVIVKNVSLTEDEPVTEKISLNEYRADHPSTFGLASSDTSEDEEEEKKTRVFPWKKLAVAAGIITIMSAVGMGTYYVVTQTDLFTATEEKEEPPAVQSDTLKIKPVAKAAEKPVKKPAADTIKKEEPKDTVKEAIAATEKYTPTKPRWETTDKPPVKETAPAKVRSTPKIAAAKETTPKVTRTKPVTPSFSSTVPKRTSSKEEVYTVELYSTPSAEDANMWVGKLKSRNITDVNIQQHKYRDKIIYKVRFGKFSTREEAKQQALKLGYPQTWVDRVK